MHFIIAGANLSNTANPGVTQFAQDLSEALETILDLEAQGYTVRISNPDGDEISLDRIKALGVLIKEA